MSNPVMAWLVVTLVRWLRSRRLQRPFHTHLKTSRRKDSPLQHLLLLPAEIRTQIYSHLVVPGRVYFSPLRDTDSSCQRLRDYQSYSKPSLNIFRVCRQIYDEAEHEYATKNMFVLPSDFRFQRPSQPHERPLMSTRAWKNVRNVSISFATGALPIHEMLPDLTIDYWTCSWTETEGDAVARRWRARNREGHTRETHNLMTTYCMNRMVDRIRDLYTLLPSQPLASLEVDIASCFCPMGCHRLLEYVGRYLTILQLPNRLHVLGAWDVDEMRQFGAEVQKSMLWFRDRKFCIHFEQFQGAPRWGKGDGVVKKEPVGGQEFYYCFECAPGYDAETTERARLQSRPRCWGQHGEERVLNPDPKKLTVNVPKPVYYPEPTLPIEL